MRNFCPGPLHGVLDSLTVRALRSWLMDLGPGTSAKRWTLPQAQGIGQKPSPSIKHFEAQILANHIQECKITTDSLHDFNTFESFLLGVNLGNLPAPSSTSLGFRTLPRILAHRPRVRVGKATAAKSVPKTPGIHQEYS